MKVIKFIAASMLLTALLFLVFGAALGSINLNEWGRTNFAYFVVVVAVSDIFLIRLFEKNKTS